VDDNTAAVLLEIQDRANTHIRHDLLGRYLNLDGSRIAAIALTGYVLRVIPDQRGNILRKRSAAASNYGQRDGEAGNVMQDHPKHEGTHKNELTPSERPEIPTQPPGDEPASGM
jgi:hypothetical protein